jgi:K+-transporting ATPase KdpF subunit
MAGIYFTQIFKRTDKMGFFISGIVALIMLAYLTYAMFNPEKF